MAFAELEPFGSHYDDLRAGTVASAILNVHRNSKVRPQPFGPLDLMAWNEIHRAGGAPAEPIELESPKRQADLIRAVMFGIPPCRTS